VAHSSPTLIAEWRDGARPCQTHSHHRARPARTDGDRVQQLTFVFTDIEGSTRLLEELRERYADVLARHGELICNAASRTGGEIVDTQRDAFFLAFRSPAQAVAFAADAQGALERERWPGEGRVRVRMGIHAGEAVRTATGNRGHRLHLGRREHLLAAGPVAVRCDRVDEAVGQLAGQIAGGCQHAVSIDDGIA
jgi:class 3 adenylate cyclase